MSMSSSRSASHSRTNPWGRWRRAVLWIMAVAISPPAITLAQETPVDSRESDTRPRIGLVLSGGGARGAAHVGVLQVLEEMRVPVDFVVGTSMGSIIGGLYSIGYSPDEMKTIISEADWARILSDEPLRENLWFRRRQDQRRFQIDVEFGWSDGSPTLPPGLIQGLNVEAFLQQLTLSVDTSVDFDQLQIPFRCVAADLSDGSAVVLDHGNLAKSIRASMSLPGIFAPVVLDGRILVDGGVIDNAPVAVARRMGADIVIAVDISTPLSDPSTLRSLLSISDQVMGFLTAENRRLSMESLTGDDIAIVPDLEDITTMAFDRSLDAIRLGYGSADMDETRKSLSALSVDEAQWREWLAQQRMTPSEPYSVRNVVVESDTVFSDEVVRRTAGLEAGDTIDAEALKNARDRIAGLGIYEHIEIDVEPVEDSDGQADIVLRPAEKSWGRHYLRFGLGAESDLRGNGEFDIGFQHTWTPINSLGGEWRNEVQVGTRTRLFTQFFQPLDPALRWYLAPSVEYQQDVLPVIVNRTKIAEVKVEALEAGLTLGRHLGSWGAAQVRYGWLTGTASPEVAVPGILPGHTNIDRPLLTTELWVDTLDDIRFPKSGMFGLATWEYSDDDLGGETPISTLQAKAGVPLTKESVTFLPTLEVGTTFENNQAVGGEFFLGGYQRLSGLGLREISGNHYALGVAQAYWQLSRPKTNFGSTTYVGASLEYGGVWQDRNDVTSDDMILAGSVFVALDSLLGPVYLGFGLAEEGESAIYVLIAPVF